MINRIHQALHRPEKGWDPVPAAHVDEYGRFAWDYLIDESTIEWIESTSGNLSGQRALDLGGGPGQYSVALAKRGANVTWHDVSAGYERFTRRKAQEAGVKISFSLGYLEDAERFGEGTFDLVFCRSCWYYSIADKPFARMLYKLVKPGGCCFINTPLDGTAAVSLPRRLQRALYDSLDYKIGHPMPARGRVPALFKDFGVRDFQTRLLAKNEEEILFRRPE